jgi:hypothetical protein
MATNYPINHHLYTFLWNKYRPVVLKLMVDSAEAPQNYKFINHEFKDINAKEKGGYSFTMELANSKPLNNIKGSVVAQDLLIMLQKSRTAIELMESATYEIILDKQFMLHVSSIPNPEVIDETESEDENTESVEATIEAESTKK